MQIHGVKLDIVADTEKWPYAELEIDFATKDHEAASAWASARWFLGISAQGVSTIEYKVGEITNPFSTANPFHLISYKVGSTI